MGATALPERGAFFFLCGAQVPLSRSSRGAVGWLLTHSFGIGTAEDPTIFEWKHTKGEPEGPPLVISSFYSNQEFAATGI
jgi:hypothetical protein